MAVQAWTGMNSLIAMARSLQRMVRHGGNRMRRASGEESSFCGARSHRNLHPLCSFLLFPSLTATSILLRTPAVLRVKERILMLLSSLSIQDQYSRPNRSEEQRDSA